MGVQTISNWPGHELVTRACVDTGSDTNGQAPQYTRELKLASQFDGTSWQAAPF